MGQIELPHLAERTSPPLPLPFPVFPVHSLTTTYTPPLGRPFSDDHWASKGSLVLLDTP